MNLSSWRDRVVHLFRLLSAGIPIEGLLGSDFSGRPVSAKDVTVVCVWSALPSTWPETDSLLLKSVK